MIERAHVSVADLSIFLLQLVQSVFASELVNLIIDDTLVPHCAETRTSISAKKDHSHKANRPIFLNSQCWGTLALVVQVTTGLALTVPMRSWLVEESGQRGKLWVAQQLIESVREHVKDARLLIDACFMRRSLILPLLEQRVRIIGQLRWDTALYLPPEPEHKQRGRKCKYGLRIDAAMLAALPVTEMELTLYGKAQPVQIRSVIAVASFLKGQVVQAVWCEMHQADNAWSCPSAPGDRYGSAGTSRMEIYARRWWGVAKLWQQSRPAMELWMQIRCIAYALAQLLAQCLWESFPLMDIAPWCKVGMITAGLFGPWLRLQFIGLRVRHSYDRKSGQFQMPFPGQNQRLQCCVTGAWRRAGSNRCVFAFLTGRHQRYSGRREAGGV